MSKRHPRKTLIELITTRAERSFPLDLIHSKEGWDLWLKHWVKTGESLHQEFLDEGLPETAKAIKERVDWQRSHFAS